MAAPRILLVDDEPFILRSLSAVLAAEGFEVLEASGGGAAIDRIRREHPDVVVFDVAMLRRDGGRALGELRRDAPLLQRGPAHIILLTGKSDPADRELGLELGAREFVAKPFSPSAFAVRIRELLDGAAAR